MKLRYSITILIASVISAGAIAQSEEPTEVDSIFMSLVKIVGNTSPQQEEDAEIEAFNLGALDYLSSVYEDSDYYMTGTCGDYQNGEIDTSVYVHGLPEHIILQFRRPILGRITSPFGLRKGGKRMHKGVDISLCRGDSIKAAFSGTVARVGYERHGYGYFIIIDHADGVQSRYAHLHRPLAKPGDPVLPGKIIGLGGSTGNSTGPHLHFEIRRYGKPVDPTPLLTRRPSFKY